MKSKYDHIAVEKKWQKVWKEKKLFKAEIDSSKPKYYILDMFPYPSGAGLHVGHVTGYTATDILARYKRQKGFNVLHPIGWDSFGLPAEQYAVRTGTHPAVTTEKNIQTYHRQLTSLGFSYDWDRELATSDPKYYKWTQWIFTKLYEQGLAYEAEILVNFCPALGTVLANEEVDDGKSKEGGYPVERRPLRQWVLKITAYAERLLNDLDLLDWPDYLKRLQRNWIGKSEGVKITFNETKTNEPITVFTTRGDTLYGTTFLVLSPEHPLVDKITTADQKKAVKAYQVETSQKSDLERTELSKIKTGIPTGAYARNPISGKEIPVWVADYVLMGYGTGAVMGVPSNDERDFEFVQKYDLPIIEVYEDEKLINSEQFNGLGVPDAKEAITIWLEENKCGERTIIYKLRDWLFSRQRYWGEPFPILHFEDGSKRVLGLDELPLTPPELTDYKPSGDGNSPLAKVRDWVEITDPKTGRKALRETNTMPQWAGSCWYYLRFVDPHNDHEAWSKEAEKYWLPVDMYVGGVEHAVLHLLYARFWHKVLYDLKLVSTIEPFQTLRNQGLVTAPSYKKSGGGYVDPDQVKEKDHKHFDKKTGEEVETLVEKMSKSKLNGVTPDLLVEEIGADSVRLYEMFMGPFDKEKLWNSQAVSGCRRFLDRFYSLFTSPKVSDEENLAALKLGTRLINDVQKDIEGLYFNTAIAKMMEFINDLTKLDAYPKKVLKMAVQALSPFAPHLAEECWELLGEKELLTFAPYPDIDPTLLTDDNVTFIVQINGKLRGKWELPIGQSKEDLLTFIRTQPKLESYLQGEIVKVIFVPDKLINLVVK